MMSQMMFRKGRGRKAFAACLALALLLGTLSLWPGWASAAVMPLPGPGNPLVYDDFSGGGLYKGNWMNWYNQNGGTGTFTKTTVDSRQVGVFAQTPASASSWAKFQPMNETVDLSGYRYLNVTMKNPGYPDSLIRIAVIDGSHSYSLTGGWVSVPTDWTTAKYDLDTLAPALNKKAAKLEIWLRQAGGAYGETLIDDIVASNDYSGTAPVLTGSMTANSTGGYTPNTTFWFQASYSDADNQKPYAMQLIIDDTAYDMLEADAADTTYTDGKSFYLITKLPAGTHTYYFRTTDLTTDEVATALQSLTVAPSEQAIDVVVSQAGYNANGYKTAKVVAQLPLTNTAYEVKSGATVVASGTMTYEGVTWNKHVYTIDFSSVTATGNDYTVVSNGVSSFPFAIKPNVWNDYKDEMTAFYRLQRASVATADAYPAGYSSVAPSAKLYHGAGHLDDALSEDGSTHYDLTGSWYDAGDYGKYAGNQWVGTEIALAYIRHADASSVKFDNDANGVPDLVDEAMFGSDYLIRFANQLGGALYDLKNNAGFIHPEKSTDNISGTADDRKLSNLGVAGSAKAAATLAATARAIHTAIAKGDVAPAQVAPLQDFADECEAAAVTFYNYVVANPNGPVGSYGTRGGIPNAKLLADVELYLLTNDTAYKNAAAANIQTLMFSDLASTNYWDMRPMAMTEFYPVADTTTQAHIHSLLKEQFDFFLSSTDDTPYGVLNQFKNFGVNEPHASYLGDMMRYYELFQDPAALRAVEKGMYWIFGENPWNISWVSGIGTNFVKYPHTRFDEGANSKPGTGIVVPGAMVSGPNMKDTKDRLSVSPWYEDRPLNQDDTNQWRYNEYSISIQAGLLYTVMGLSANPGANSAGAAEPAKLPVLSPVIGGYVRGNVTIFAGPATGLTAVESNAGGTYVPMSPSGAVYAATVDESATAPYTSKRIDVRGTDAAGNHTYSSTHYTVLAPLPDPAHPLLYDDFGGGGLWGAVGGTGEWVNWYNQNGGTGTFTRTTVDGRTVGKFAQTPTATNSAAKFQPWHDFVDLSGYRYLSVTAKNPGYPNLRMKIEVNDGSRTYNLTGGWTSVPAEWTELNYDLNALTPAINKQKVTIAIWLNQTAVGYGEMLIDEIKAKNTATGSAPTLSAVTVDQTSGDTTTDFTFSAVYTDADNEKPFAVELVVDGVVHRMEAVDPSDTLYSDGKAYSTTIRLVPGVHSFYVHTTDTTSNAVSSPVQTGPTVSLAAETLFFDDFSDGNADGWTPTSGTWSVQSAQYMGQAGSGSSLSVAGDSSWTDYTFQAKVNVTNNVNGNKDAGLVFRYTDPGNTYMILLKNNDKPGGKIELIKYVNGVKTNLAFTSADIAADTFYTYKIVLSGSNISVYKDDVLQLTATDSSHASGKIGARTYANTRAYFDDVMVTR